jgi:DNA topoisomerase-1
MKTMVLCEKPSAAAKIAFALAEKKPVKRMENGVPYYIVERGGKSLIVVPAVGHLFVLDTKNGSDWSYPVFSVDWKPTYFGKKSYWAKKYFDNIKKVSKEASEFISATDYDIEGSVIAYNILRFICGKKDGRRMKFSTLTKPDIVEAYEQASEHLDFPQIEAGLTRHYMDFLWGVNATRALSMALRSAGGYKTLSTGRVQGPTLKLLEDRQKEITAFIPKLYWQIQLAGLIRNEKITAMHIQGNFWEKREAEKIFEKCRGRPAAVEGVEKKRYKQLPPVPFDLTTMQREAYRNFGFSPKQTLDIAQTLYEMGAISYPRTSSQKLPAKIGYRNIINSLKTLEQYKGLADILLKKHSLKPREGEKTDPAHPSIFPTPDVPDIKKMNSYQAKLYDIIVKRFLSLFAEPAVRESLRITIDIEKEKFISDGVRTIEPGWMEFYKPYSKMKETILPDAKKGEKVEVKKLEMPEKKTEPPERYSQASILQKMEALELGTKSTRALILQTLYDRGYIFDRSIQVTELGSIVVEALDRYCPEIVSADLTKKFESEISAVMDGNRKREDIVVEAEAMLKGIFSTFRKSEKEIGAELLKGVRIEMRKQATVGKCVCSGDLIIRESRGKRFIGCSSYPKCTQTFSLPHTGKLTTLHKKCPKCGLFIVSVKQPGKRLWHLCVRCGFVNSSGRKPAESNKADNSTQQLG